ncbi:exodeoxyribonuclease VII large subunit [Solicola sp. PLA-1-18]|uniref:exodeoxyribonuclease VII large subunit n=1 Tax=Solicola sp. PLA-1-18 TaxID=3380532 RepID=UPI003B7977B9
MALETSAESPAPLRQVTQLLSGYLGRLGPIWVEGQVAQLNRRAGRCFLTLRDPVVEMSVSLTCHRSVLDSANPPITEGARVVVHARVSFYERTGSLSLDAREIRPVGVGELLARLEQRRQLLAAEGLFDPALKRPLPFLPHRIGLVTGRDSAAERDVLEVARRRWPGVEFDVRHALMQGSSSAAQVIEAVRSLDADPAVDVIVVARGGGSVEDLLPFSDEALVRAVSRLTTPLVSAIGHEPDVPILDLVADHRAATPTDAAKTVVPAVADELAGLDEMRHRARQAVRAHVRREEHLLDSVRGRPVLAAPQSMVDERAASVVEARDRARRSLAHRLDRAHDEVGHHLARVRGLSPLSTLRRGYAVAQLPDGTVVTSVDQVAAGTELDVRVTDGHLTVTTVATVTAPTASPGEPDAEDD